MQRSHDELKIVIYADNVPLVTAMTVLLLFPLLLPHTVVSTDKVQMLLLLNTLSLTSQVTDV